MSVSFLLRWAALLCGGGLIATEQRAMAMYVDPGSRLLALQSAASVMAATVFFLRRKIRAALGVRRKAEDYVPLLPEEG